MFLINPRRFDVGFNNSNLRFKDMVFQTGGLDTVTLPASINPKELLIMLSRSRNDSAITPANVTPSGWTEIGTAIDTKGSALFSARVKIDFKITDGSEASQTIQGMAGAHNEKRVLLIDRDGGINSAFAFNYQGFLPVVGNSNPPAQLVSVSTASNSAIVVASYGRLVTNVANRIFTPIEDQEFIHEAGNSHYVKFKIYNSNLLDTTVDHNTASTGAELQSCFIEAF